MASHPGTMAALLMVLSSKSGVRLLEAAARDLVAVLGDLQAAGGGGLLDQAGAVIPWTVCVARRQHEGAHRERGGGTSRTA